MKSNEKKTQIQITNQSISRIIIGLSEIGNIEMDDFKLSYGITRSITNLSVAEKVYLKCLNVLQKKYLKKDEKGDFIVENNFFVFPGIKERDEYNSALEKLNDEVVDAEVWPVKASDLQNVKGIKATSMAKCHELIIHDLD